MCCSVAFISVVTLGFQLQTQKRHVDVESPCTTSKPKTLFNDSRLDTRSGSGCMNIFANLNSFCDHDRCVTKRETGQEMKK